MIFELFQLGRTKEGLDALRRSVRVNPTNIAALTTLAGALSDQFRSDEAIELFWRAFDKANSLDEQLSVIAKLGELYLRANRFDQLVTRLQRLGRENNKVRDMAICLAAAYQSAGDLGSARSELERLLTEDTRDTKLLEQLSALAETEGDFTAAAKYQKRVNVIAPNKDGITRLANLHLRSGQIEHVEDITGMGFDPGSGDLYVVTKDRYLMIVDPKTGKIRWKKHLNFPPHPNKRIAVLRIAPDPTDLAFDSNGNIVLTDRAYFLLRVDKTNAQIKAWASKKPKGTWESLVFDHVSGRIIGSNTNDSSLYHVRMKTGIYRKLGGLGIGKVESMAVIPGDGVTGAKVRIVEWVEMKKQK